MHSATISISKVGHTAYHVHPPMLKVGQSTLLPNLVVIWDGFRFPIPATCVAQCTHSEMYSVWFYSRVESR